MKRVVYGVVMLAFTWVGPVKGSDPVGIYARIDRISMEPNDDKPERTSSARPAAFAAR